MLKQLLGCGNNASAMDSWANWWDKTGRDEAADRLLRDWDILGVEIFEEQAKGEYSYEAEQLGPLLRAGAGREAVADRLAQLAMDLRERSDRARDARAADSLLAWYAATQSTAWRY
jgi:hypothetical protein